MEVLAASTQTVQPYPALPVLCRRMPTMSIRSFQTLRSPIQRWALWVMEHLFCLLLTVPQLRANWALSLPLIFPHARHNLSYHKDSICSCIDLYILLFSVFFLHVNHEHQSDFMFELFPATKKGEIEFPFFSEDWTISRPPVLHIRSNFVSWTWELYVAFPHWRCHLWLSRHNCLEVRSNWKN